MEIIAAALEPLWIKGNLHADIVQCKQQAILSDKTEHMLISD